MLTFILVSLLALVIGGVSTFFLIKKSFIPGSKITRIVVGVILGLFWSIGLTAFIRKAIELAN